MHARYVSQWPSRKLQSNIILRPVITYFDEIAHIFEMFMARSCVYTPVLVPDRRLKFKPANALFKNMRVLEFISDLN